MSGTKPWKEYTEIAERTLNRCNMKDTHEQTIHYVCICDAVDRVRTG